MAFQSATWLSTHLRIVRALAIDLRQICTIRLPNHRKTSHVTIAHRGKYREQDINALHSGLDESVLNRLTRGTEASQHMESREC